MPVLQDVPDDKTMVILIIAGTAALLVWKYHKRTCPYKTHGTFYNGIVNRS